ncbi:PIN domain nuclease [Thermococci archaeon]|uniref:PIN domain-containing protein n=1 Tax=Palaeococcus sp. (in: euryarchaeotes) TaxID=2820298 RepID=UPI000F21623A|nr:PIN domain-containing protein [Palaeococcus sp. (in: euryarchaeotes)]MCD6560011.1 PIN domain-containing protein [Palaeococcus sp. (in: euryarchaeotes)]RLF75611.1 MAG: PIN domain nuclease [Thermococci archaeon]RLF89697.1 MAG: PIN domain nuclease [Thermococci archaeon]
MVIYLDANVIVSYLLYTEKTEEARKVLEREEAFATTINTLEEAVFVGMRLIFEEYYGDYKLKKFKKTLKQNFEIYQQYLSNLNRLVSELPIVLLPVPSDLTSLVQVMEGYSLLPNDALIALTCKVQKIDKIATFDSDFRGVDFLKVIP